MNPYRKWAGHVTHLGTRLKAAAVGATLALGLAGAMPAQALTIVLNFVNAPTTDINGVRTTPETFASWGFTGLLTLDAIRNATLAAVQTDYLAYPNAAQNPLSPLPVGKQLDIDFVWSSGLTGPNNGDADYFYVDIGDANPNQGFLGQACLDCVRNSAGLSSQPAGAVVGSILSDSIAALLNLAGNDTQRINLLAGTVSHEIGHSLTLRHPSGALANPGASAYSLMGTGASPTLMPSSERVKDRAFAYTEFASLIQSIGLRDVSPIPEPGAAWLLALGLGVVVLRARERRADASAQPVLQS